MSRTATTYIDYQQRAAGFEVGDRVTPYFDGAGEDYAGVVTAVWPAIGMVDVEFPHGSKRYPVEDLQILEKAHEREYDMPQSPSIPGGVGSVPVSGGPKDKQARELVALYWAQKDRKYRPCKSEQDGGRYTCPRCRDEFGERVRLVRVPYKRTDGISERILSCPTCTFVIGDADILSPDCSDLEGDAGVKLAGKAPASNPFLKPKVKVVFSHRMGDYSIEIDEPGAAEYLIEFGKVSGYRTSNITSLREDQVRDWLNPSQVNSLEQGRNITLKLDPWTMLHYWPADAQVMAEGYDPFIDGRRSRMSTLHERTIRLAYENPELRKHLLPVLKQAGCEKLPEALRENCEDMKDGKDITAGKMPPIEDWARDYGQQYNANPDNWMPIVTLDWLDGKYAFALPKCTFFFPYASNRYAGPQKGSKEDLRLLKFRIKSINDKLERLMDNSHQLITKGLKEVPKGYEVYVMSTGDLDEYAEVLKRVAKLGSNQIILKVIG